MADTQQGDNNKNPIFSLLPKIHFPLPFLNNQHGRAETVSDEPNRITSETGGGDSVAPAKVEVVRFPATKTEVPPLKIENEDAEQGSNPLVLWQVYALGGFMILRWVWSKWQHRRPNPNSEDQHPPPPTD